ncbi:folliculin isoform X2 [Oratosquilla oratoria]|uniref:folliculin isoform X2 n=1 Tax=Oratosquilla oratoria TaxID=337810 RepID=UPI003F766178
MNAIVSLCHFCELHGPSVVFCTQAFRDLPTLQENPTADKEESCREQGKSSIHQKKNLWTYGFMQPPVTSPELSMTGSDTCLACRSIPHNKPGYISNDDVAHVSYISSQYPLQPELFTLMRQACIRSLSCEVCPGQEGPIYFGDDTRGQVLAYTFFLQDVQARGFKRMYSVLVLMKDKMFLLNSWAFLVKHLKQIIGELQHKATKVYKTEEAHVSHRALRSAASLTPDNFRRQRVGQPRSFCEVVGDETVWKMLHSWFTWVLKAGGLRLREKVVEGPPSYTFSSTTEEHDAFTVRDLHGWLGGSAFRCLLHHLLIGHQVIIKGHDDEVVSRIVAALLPLLPKHSYQAVKFSREYQANCNVLGLHSSVIVPDAVLQLGGTCILSLSPQELQVLYAANKYDLVKKDHSVHCANTASHQDKDGTGAEDKKNEVLMKFKYQITNEGPLPCRPPQVLGRIEAAIVNPAVSASTLLVFLATIMEEWINKAKVWAHVQSTSHHISESSSTEGIHQSSNSSQLHPPILSVSPSSSPSSPLSPFSHRIMHSPMSSPVLPLPSPSSATTFSSPCHSLGTTDVHQLLVALGATEWDLPLLQFWSVGLSS